MTIYALSMQITQPLPADQSALAVPEADWRSELALALQASLEEGMIAQGKLATNLANTLVQQAKIYTDTTTTAEPDFEDRFNPATGHYTETTGHSQTAHHSLSIQTVDVGAWADLQMGLDEWQDLLTRSANSFYNDAEIEFSVSPALKDVLHTCELARVQKFAHQFTIVPQSPAPGPLRDYTQSLPPLPKKAGEILIVGATTFRLPLYDADPSPFLSGHKEFIGMPTHLLGSHFAGQYLQLSSARLEPRAPLFPTHPGPTLSTTAKRMLDAIQGNAEHPALIDFIDNSLRHATSGLAEQVQLIAEVMSRAKFAPYAVAHALLGQLSTQPDEHSMGLSMTDCCIQACRKLQEDGGLQEAMGALMRAQQLCHPTRLTDIVAEVLRDAPSMQSPGLKRD